MYKREIQKQRQDKSILSLFSQMLGKQHLAFNEYLICRGALKTHDSSEIWVIAAGTELAHGLLSTFSAFLPLIFLKRQKNRQNPTAAFTQKVPHPLILYPLPPLLHPQCSGIEG